MCNFVKKHQRLQLLIQELTDETTDIAEGKLLIAIREGKDWAVRYWLDNRAQERGYGQRKLAFRDGDGAVMVPAVLVTDGRISTVEWQEKYGEPADPALPATTH